MIEMNNESLSEAREKLAQKATFNEGVEILKKMYELAEDFKWRSDVMSPCCGGNLDGYCMKYDSAGKLLDEIFIRLEDGNVKEADPLLDMLKEQLSHNVGLPDEIVKIYETPPGKQ